MGCSPGKDSHMLIVFDSAEFKADLKVFERLKLNTKDSHNLYQVFDKLLSDDMRTVSQEKLRDYTGLPSTAFVKEILSILNPSQSEDLNFRGFVVCLWNYCTLTRDNMDLFLFDLYQPHSPADAQAIICEMYGGDDEAKSDPHAQSTVAELNTLGKRKKTFNKERFRVFMMQHQAVLRPAFQIQQVLQNKISGVQFWEEQTEIRKTLCPDPYISIAQILDPVKSGLHNGYASSAKGSSKKRPSPDYVGWKRKLSIDKVFVDAHGGGMMLYDPPNLSAATKRNNSFHELLQNSTKTESTKNGARSGSDITSNATGSGANSGASPSCGSGSGSGSGRGSKKDRGIATVGSLDSLSSPTKGGLFGNYESPSRRHRKSVLASTVTAPSERVAPKVTFKTMHYGDIDMEEIE